MNETNLCKKHQLVSRPTVLFLLACATISFTRCGTSTRDSTPPIPAEEAELIWRTHCDACHQTPSLRANDAAQVKLAMDQTPEMEAFRGQFADHELAGILAWLDTAGRSRDAN